MFALVALGHGSNEMKILCQLFYILDTERFGTERFIVKQPAYAVYDHTGLASQHISKLSLHLHIPRNLFWLFEILPNEPLF